MTETWVHPVTAGREAGPAWIPRWRFRLIALVVLAILVLLVVIAYHYLSGAGDGTQIKGQITKAFGSSLEHFRRYGDNRLGS